jgi:phosphopantothenate synthetase
MKAADVIRIDKELSMKIIERALETDKAIMRLVEHNIFETKREAVKKLNKMIYDMAEERGVGVHDICFSTIPDWQYKRDLVPRDSPPQSFRATVEVILRPIEFTFD